MKAPPLQYHLRSLFRRKTRTILTAAGIAIAVLVALLMLALVRGISSSLEATGHPENVLVTARGAETLEFSALDRSVVPVLATLPYLAGTGPAISPEILFAATCEIPGRPPTQAVVRGVLENAWPIHHQVRLREGRFPSAPGELMAGPLVAAKLGIPDASLAPGSSLVLDGRSWTIVGLFEAPGTAFEAELWGGLDDLMTATRRDELNMVVLRARDAAAREELLFDLETRTDIVVAARSEQAYYAAHARSFEPLSRAVEIMAALLVFGGALIGMNTLFASVVSRTREIGMLRTLGFRRWQLACGFALEGALPAVLGSLAACLAALALNGFALRIPMGAFRISVTPSLLLLGVGLGLFIGLAGSALGIWRAVRLRTIEAIRHL